MVLASARQLDERERARHDQNVRSREESELRAKLSGALPSSHQQIDDELLAATVQTEADVLNELLAESDRISSDLRLYD
jgi:Lon protease-like protein